MKNYRCPDCAFSSNDPSVTFAHMTQRQCRPVVKPVWVARAAFGGWDSARAPTLLR